MKHTIAIHAYVKLTLALTSPAKYRFPTRLAAGLKLEQLLL
jgi:hypothetical protein